MSYTDDEIYEMHERAAILEYDLGMTRVDANLAARGMMLKRREVQDGDMRGDNGDFVGAFRSSDRLNGAEIP